jgi:hypothetical protein
VGASSNSAPLCTARHYAGPACKPGVSAADRPTCHPLRTGRKPHSLAPTLAVDRAGTGVESATVCAFSPRPIPFRRLLVLDKALFFMCCKARRSKVGRSGQGSTARRRSGGLVPRWRSKQKWLPATSVRRQLPSATATPELGLARADDARPLAASQPFFVLAPRRAVHSFSAHQSSGQLFFFRPIQPHSSS